MAYNSQTYVDPVKRGRGRFVVSQGVAPAESIQVDDTLPTLLTDPVHEEFFEAVVLKGTIMSVYPAPSGSGAEADGITYVAGPCTAGTTGYELQLKLVTVATGAVAYVDVADGAGVGQEIIGSEYRLKSTHTQQGVPQGVFSMDAYRPFDENENEGVSWITHGYVEWPLSAKYDDVDTATAVEIFDNTDLTVGDFVMPDELGRPVKWSDIWGEKLKVARVVMRQDLAGAAPDYDYGFLQWLQVPVDDFERSLLQTIHQSSIYDTDTHTTTEQFGVRANVDAMLDEYEVDTYGTDTAAGVVGCIRAQLINL